MFDRNKQHRMRMKSIGKTNTIQSRCWRYLVCSVQRTLHLRFSCYSFHKCHTITFQSTKYKVFFKKKNLPGTKQKTKFLTNKNKHQYSTWANNKLSTVCLKILQENTNRCASDKNHQTQQILDRLMHALQYIKQTTN